jgi:nicotinamide phosphoribosyltransferase
MKGLNALLLCDFYKVSHRVQYPNGTEQVYSTWTPRSNKHYQSVDKVVAFGFQGFVQEYLIDFFNDNFFNQQKDKVVTEYKRIIKNCLFVENPDSSHIEALHDLGYLPILINSLDEGTLVPLRVPMLTIENTLPEFFWLTNYLETLMSSTLWKPATTASIARVYNQLLTNYALTTTGSKDFVMFQGHDFSMRGMSGLEDSARSGAGHLLSFVGTDTVPAIQYLEQYYNANSEKELIGCSVNATEHSIMCSGSKEGELETYRRLIQDVYPTGIVSLVSDTWDLWNVLTNIIPKLKPIILSRNGGPGSIDKVVIRPDSGDPALIICGNPNGKTDAEKKGVVELLWETFGGTVTPQGYKMLDSHIGCIYGDAITIEKCNEICEGLKQKGFASTNMVFGIGSYTYQYLTRDTLGFAMKATSVTINGVEQSIFKDPVTDDGVKKSAVGKVAVVDNNGLEIVENVDLSTVKNNLLTPLFLDGKLMKTVSLGEIREKLK